MRNSTLWIGTPCLAALLGATAGAQSTQQVSFDSAGAPTNHHSDLAAISGDARCVAFMSYASDLVLDDTNGKPDIFVRDRQTGTTERVSVDSNEVQGDGNSFWPSISADGRYVSFHSVSTNLVPGDTNAVADVFVRDRQSGSTVRASVASGGSEGNGASDLSSLSDDGLFVAFRSTASNFLIGDTNGWADVFVRDLQNDITERVSISSGGAQANFESSLPYLSADGRYVVFQCFATNLVPGDTNGTTDIFVRDRASGTTERVSVSTGGAQANGISLESAISGDGRYVSFWSAGSTLVAGDTNNAYDVFLRDRQSGTTERVSLSSAGVQGDIDSWGPTSVSDDGRYVSFSSTATILVANDFNSCWDVFVRDRQTSSTVRISVESNGTEGNGDSYGPSPFSADGRFVAFGSYAYNLDAGDGNLASDIFVRDFNAAGFTSLCDPGLDGVMACPCSNPPSGPGRGCENSSATGGAVLTASGAAYLSMDSLVFTTNGEKPTATSIVMQGNAPIAAGVGFGQGVRCVGGSLKRLYTKMASGGSITAPDFGLGDPTVSTRSAALGDTIQAGESRWYLVYYRDPTVLGGCPAGSTFNATQTGRVDWSL